MHLARSSLIQNTGLSPRILRRKVANHVLGKTAEAAQAYKNAEQILPVAAQRIHMDGLDKKYLATLKRVQQEHLVLLQQIGDTSGAATLEKKIESDPK